MENNVGWLSRGECSALRGIAIMAIVLHNYCHWLGMAVKENEFTFRAGNSVRLLGELSSPDIYLPVHLFSYFGHYGVPVFLFLSGFGLAVKYGRRDSLPAWGFARCHYLKLLRMMIPGFVAFTMLDAITPGAFRFHAENVVAQLLMYINLLPRPDRVIWPGPYWFFGLMMQFYLVYMLLRRRHWAWTAVLMAVCLLLQMLCDPAGDALNRLRYNFAGGMLAFGAGLLSVRPRLCGLLSRAGRPVWGAVAAVAALLAFAACFSYHAWLWTPLLVILSAVGTVKVLPCRVLGVCSWLGGISAAMFVAHPILRKIFIPVSRGGDIYDGLLLYVIATVAVAWMFRLLINKIPDPRL